MDQLAALAISLAQVFTPDFANRVQALYASGGAAAELLAILITFLPVTWAVRDATVKSQRRPFLSLIGPDLRFDWRRFGLGALVWLAAILAVGLAAPWLPLPPLPAAAKVTPPPPPRPRPRPVPARSTSRPATR